MIALDECYSSIYLLARWCMLACVLVQCIVVVVRKLFAGLGGG